jgi:hypothetical protein
VAKSLLKRRRGPVEDAPPHVVRLGDDVDEARLTASFASERITIELEVPVQYVVLQGGFSFASRANPFVAGLEGGAAALASFYDDHRPNDLCEMYGLDRRGGTGEDLAPWELPWLHDPANRARPAAEHGLGTEHGVSYFGPATAEKVALEVDRLDAVKRSIERHGYRPTPQTGYINGHLLVSGEQYRFFVRGGKHRAAVLATLGWTHIPVRFRATWPRLVDARDASSWSLVRSGAIDEDTARAAFDTYFVGRENRSGAMTTTTTDQTRR